jgi:uncharacterized protein YjbI with pentapeptide repeats
MIAVATAIGGLTGYVATMDIGRDRRAEAIRNVISTLKNPSAEQLHLRTLDSLGSAGLAEHLEPLAIGGLLEFIRGDAVLSTPCAQPTAGRTAVSRHRADVDSAFRLIAHFQDTSRGSHSYPVRFVDAVLSRWHGERGKTRQFALDNSDLRDLNLRGLKMPSGSFVGACLAGAHLESTTLDSAHFDSAILDGAHFDQSSMRSSSLAGAHGDGTVFDRADLTDGNLNGAALRRARFFGATLSCATLGNAHLDSSYFSSAIVNWAFFGGAYLAGATNWDEIKDFSNAFVSGAHDLPPALVELSHARGAVPDSTTQTGCHEARVAQLRRRGACAPKDSRS